MSSTEYRPEVDGLRAIAVVAVILFHAGVPVVRGGYVGVDVFFVISGFLITGILLRALETGRFSIAEFYERRIRRIFPALFAVLAASAAAALALLFAGELSNFGHSLLATSLFFANYHFMNDTGYFATPALNKPLLHMWSLAVEEQFYLLFPLLLAAAWRFSRRLLTLATVLGLLSLAYSAWLMMRSPDHAFYSAPARAWELLAGATIAMAVHRGLRPAPPATAAALAWVGLAAVLVPIGLYSESTPFPGLAALPPVLGSACLLYATSTPGNAVARLLASTPMRFTGLISYSLYLWHWPVFVFYKVWRIEPISSTETTLLVVLTFVLAIVSWRWIERPFRRGGGGTARRRRVLVGGAMLMAFGTAGGLAAVLSQGFPGRFGPEVARVLAASDDAPTFTGCPAPGASTPFCPLGAPSARPPTFVLWGDSHGEALLPAVDAAARQVGVAGLYVVRGGCPPLAGVRQVREGFRDCDVHAEAFFHGLADQPSLTTVILAARWAIYAEGVRFRAEPGHVAYIVDDQAGAPSLETNAQVFERAVQRTLERLTALGRRVVLVTQVPETEFHVPRAMARSLYLGRTVELAPRLADYNQRQARVEQALHTPYARSIVHTLRPEQVLCAQQRCIVAVEGMPIYRDSNHLTATEAQRLAPLFLPTLDPPR